eukprot:754549-Hanusia_phi.AAC.5
MCKLNVPLFRTALALADAGDADEGVAEVARPLLPGHLRPGGEAVDDVALEAEGADVALVLDDLLSRRLAQGVQLVEVGEEGEVVEVLVAVPVPGEHPHVRLDGVVEVVRVDGQAPAGVRVRVVEDDGVGPRLLDLVDVRVVVRGEEGHHEHARPLVRLVDGAGVLPELRQRVLAVPVEDGVVHTAVVPVEADVPEADQVALVVDQGLGVVLVLHAPDAVLRVVVAGHLRLAPVRRPQLLRAPAPEDRRQHVVLDVGAHADQVHVVLQQGVLLAHNHVVCIRKRQPRFWVFRILALGPHPATVLAGKPGLLPEEGQHPLGHGHVRLGHGALGQDPVERLEGVGVPGVDMIPWGAEDDPDRHGDEGGVGEPDADGVADASQGVLGGEDAAAGHVVVGGVHDAGEHPGEGEAVEMGEEGLLAALAAEEGLDALLDGACGDRLVPVLAEAALLEDAVDAAEVGLAPGGGRGDGVAAELGAEDGVGGHLDAVGGEEPAGLLVPAVHEDGCCAGRLLLVVDVHGGGGQGEQPPFRQVLHDPARHGLAQRPGQGPDVRAEGARALDHLQDLVAVVEHGVVQLLGEGGGRHAEERLAAGADGGVGVGVADVLDHEEGGVGVGGGGACGPELRLRAEVGEAQEPGELALQVGGHLDVGEEGVAEPGVVERPGEARLDERLEALPGLPGHPGVEGVGGPDGVEEDRAQDAHRGRHLRRGPGRPAVLGGGGVDLRLGDLGVVDVERVAGKGQALGAEEGGLPRQCIQPVLWPLQGGPGLAELVRGPVEEAVVVDHGRRHVLHGQDAGRRDGVEPRREGQRAVRGRLEAAGVEVVHVEAGVALELAVVRLLQRQGLRGLRAEVHGRQARGGEAEGLPFEVEVLVLVLDPLDVPGRVLPVDTDGPDGFVLADVVVGEDALDPRVLDEVLEGEVEVGVLGLVVEAESVRDADPPPVGELVVDEVADAAVDAVVLGDAGPAAEHVTGGLTGVHAELAGVDDGHPPVAGEVGPLLQEHRAAGSVGQVLRLLRVEGHLHGERAVAHQEGGWLRAPALEGVLGVLDQDVEGVGVLLHDAVAVDVLPDELVGGLLRGVVLFAQVRLVGGREEQGLVHVQVVGHLDGAH